MVLNGKGYSNIIGIFLVPLGALIVLFSFLHYKRTEKQINSNTYQSSALLIVFLTVSVFVGAIVLALYLPGAFNV